MSMRVDQGPLVTADIIAPLDNDRCGALLVFEGRVRNHNEGRDVLGLEYEVYVPLAVKEGQVIIDEARQRWPVGGIACVHASGKLDIGDIAVVVAVASAHRDAGFAACRYVIDEIKARLPIWKRERYASGETEWVNCQKPVRG
ncbi:molybdenum cofactor biosynthesis protein MoaE [Marinihelvus fidelis]|uniref:Molybdopterin synthase catalytic subunit n=1 Tax=Marinihelvus fidelis TaxID=2613842 RepID=A0A5N0TAE4_9GAMM|nr:molybdenum cofactor biosynthesis protein MoaE [Marinihelvus fidelis]KAA9131910.1 molybdenum cofactor biosynthesis protein MoaE [Marinihelvus fidelis]